MQILKLFNAIFFIALFNFSDCIAVKKDSAIPEEKKEFDLYLNNIQEIGNLTPHAKAHFFSGDRPLSPPNKKDGDKFFLNFTKHQDKEGYSAFTTPWETVKDYIKTNANEINRSENNQAFTYTVNFENPLPAYKITDISFPNNPNNDSEADDNDSEAECSKANIEKMAGNNAAFLNNPLGIKQKDQKEKLKTFNGCLQKINYTKQKHEVNQARFIVVKGEKQKEIKTAYPIIINPPPRNLSHQP